MTDVSAPTEAPADETPALAALGAHARGVVAAVVQWVADLAHLASLEARLAGLSLAGIMFSALAAAFTVLSAWLLLQAALVAGLARAGVNPVWVLLALTAVNAALSVLLILAIRRLSHNLTFRATRRAALERGDETPAA